jgi:hypothetical protein
MKSDAVGTINRTSHFIRAILQACGTVLDNESHLGLAWGRQTLGLRVV